jgi:hypothetical protein
MSNPFEEKLKSFMQAQGIQGEHRVFSQSCHSVAEAAAAVGGSPADVTLQSRVARRYEWRSKVKAKRFLGLYAEPSSRASNPPSLKGYTQFIKKSKNGPAD